MSYFKFLPILVFLLSSMAQSPAQWRSNPWPPTNSGQFGMCSNIEITVRDAMGMAITGAEIVVDDSLMQFTTDARGLTEIPCRSGGSFLPMMEVSAPGYHTSKVRIVPGANNRLEVILDRRDPISKTPEMTVSAKELNQAIQMESQELQNQASSAIQRGDYDTAGKLLFKALQLTPSAAWIANNLGVVALRQKNLNAAGHWFEQAVKMAPGKADIMGNLGIVRWMQERTEESYKLLKRAADMGYESGAGNYIIGVVSLKNGENKEAVEYLKKTSADRFSYRDLYLSTALHNLGKTKAAEEAYRNFLKRNPVPYAFGIP